MRWQQLQRAHQLGRSEADGISPLRGAFLVDIDRHAQEAQRVPFAFVTRILPIASLELLAPLHKIAVFVQGFLETYPTGLDCSQFPFQF